MPRCAGTKRDGQRCTATVEPPNEYCWWHDPANAGQRKRAASKGGKGKPNREIRDLKDQLAALADDVLGGRTGRGDAAVVNQILGTRARLIELERKVRETEDLEGRIEDLERSQERGDSKWRRA